jgi:probable HAF family extracellular repeat protein
MTWFAAHFRVIGPSGQAIFAAPGNFRGDELMRSKHCAFLAVLLSVSAASAAFAAASLTPLGDLPGGSFGSYASGVSGDGSTVVGNSYSASGQEAFRWTSESGMVGLGDLPGAGFVSYANGVSGDGSVVVGSSYSVDGDQAFRWTSEGGMVGLGYPPGEPLVDPYSTATGVSGDGSVVVGVGSLDFRDFVPAVAFRWTSDSGMGGLGNLPPPFWGRAASGVSGDGSVVVGGIWDDGSEAFRWTSEGGMVVLDGQPFDDSSAFGVNADGSVIVGWGTSASGREAFRWTSDGGMVGLGILPGNVYSIARGVSGDGSVVVGYNSSENYGDYHYHEAFRWTSGGGMERLWDVLVDQGVDPAADGWTNLAVALGISADGRTIVGTGVRNGNAEAFAAVIPIVPDLLGDFNFDGTVNAADYVVWRKGVGIAPTQENYNLWRSNFGRTSGSGLAASENPVPEPASLALLTLAAPALLRRRQEPEWGKCGC